MLQSTLKHLGGSIWVMSTMAERINEAMGEMTPGELAKAADVTPGAVTQWRDGSVKSLSAKSAAKLEKVTGYRAVWIATGRGPKKLEGFTAGQREVTAADLQMLEDFYSLLEDDQTRLLEEIRTGAAKMRAHLAKLNGQGGGASVAADPPARAALDPDATAARLLADDKRLDELARRKRGDRLK